MKRRGFLKLASLSFAWPSLARAASDIKQLGFLSAYSMEGGRELIKCFGDGLAARGWQQGLNVNVNYRWVGNRPELFVQYADELIALRPDLLVCNSTPAAQALQKATSAIPIIFMSVSDPVVSGIVSSLSRPIANVTGIANFLSATAGKLFELYHLTNPTVDRIAIIFDHSNQGKWLQLKEIEQAATKSGVTIQVPGVRTGEEISELFSTISSARNAGVICLIDGVTTSNRQLIVDLATKFRVPAAFDARTFVDAGGLMSYGLNLCGHFRRGADYADSVLRGKKPSELPVELPTTFEFVVNLKAARAIGSEIPSSILNLADDIID